MDEERLPTACYGVLSGVLVYLQPNQPYCPEPMYEKGDPDLNSREAERLNAILGVTPSQRAAMEAGAILGWQSPQAQPWRYDENGTPYPVHRGYVITSRTRVGEVEISFGENPEAVQPFVTWRANEWGAFQDYYWGHYHTDRDAALEDYADRIREARSDLARQLNRPPRRRGPER